MSRERLKKTIAAKKGRRICDSRLMRLESRGVEEVRWPNGEGALIQVASPGVLPPLTNTALVLLSRC